MCDKIATKVLITLCTLYGKLDSGIVIWAIFVRQWRYLYSFGQSSPQYFCNSGLRLFPCVKPGIWKQLQKSFFVLKQLTVNFFVILNMHVFIKYDKPKATLPIMVGIVAILYTFIELTLSYKFSQVTNKIKTQKYQF